MLARMYLIMALATNNNEVLFNVRSSVFVMFNVVEFEYSRVVLRPPFDVPSTNTTGVVITCVNGLLDCLRDSPIVRFRDPLL